MAYPSAPRPRAVDPLPLAAIAVRIGARITGDELVTGITHDSRQVQPGDLYAAMSGIQVHGADFARAAVAAGARAVLTDPVAAARLADLGVPLVVVDDPRAALGPAAAAIYADPSAQLVIVGVTGTNGKTTTTFLTEAALAAGGHRTGLIGTVVTKVGDQELTSVRTTPEASDLQALFAVMVERGVSAVAMEVSSHALALGRVRGTVFRAAAFTNLTQDHLDFHRDMDDYFAAKSLLFTTDYTNSAVVCVDDDYGRRLAATTEIACQTVSVEGPADWSVAEVELGADGSTFELHGPRDIELGASVRIPAAFNVANAVTAIALASAAGIDPTIAARAIADVPGVPGRLEAIRAGQPFTVVVDYAHTPAAVSGVLAALRPVTRGRLIAVLGCGGDRDRGKRPLMGQALADGADVAIATTDNPRSEDPSAILADMAAGDRRLRVVLDRTDAIELALTTARSGDTVVIAGRGHEQQQYLADGPHPFDDRVVVADLLASRWSA